MIKNQNVVTLSAIFFLLLFLFSVSIFKNISFPLFWNDEAETAMFAERILKFGYPKIHDGKNALFLLNCLISENKKYDMYTSSGWVQYYFAAPGASLAHQTDNLYTKTAIMRIPFALIGVAGILLLAMTVQKLFNGITNKLLFLITFIFFELLSVPLALHLREVRYYSIQIFISSLLIYTYFNYAIFNKTNFKTYFSLAVLLLFLLFNTYYPAYFIFLIVLGICQLAKRPDGQLTDKIKSHFKDISPLIASLVLTIPLLIFFKYLQISDFFYKRVEFTLVSYALNFLRILEFFEDYDFLYLFLFVKLCLFFLYLYFKQKKLAFPAKEMLSVSYFLFLFFITYTMIIARSPYFFERYFIVLQPIFTLILILDAFILFEGLKYVKYAIRIKTFTFLSVVIIFSLSLTNIVCPIKGHIYELFHQYKGPLDYVIPYIKGNFNKPENLVVATSYEEASYMYYLDCKTIVGFNWYNVLEDRKEKPDILIYRGKQKQSPTPFRTFYKRSKYKKISFPVRDYQVNNIPEMSLHLFRTPFAETKAEELKIYVKEGTI